VHRITNDGVKLGGANTKHLNETDPELAAAEEFDPKREGGWQ
jgi:hypothetical protein